MDGARIYGFPVRQALLAAALAVICVLPFGGCAEDGGSGQDEPVPDSASPVVPDSGDTQPDTSSRTGGSAVFLDTYGFDETYLMDVGTLRGLIVEGSTSTKVPDRSVVGIVVTVQEGYQLIDIRPMALYAKGFVPGSVSIPGGGQFRVRVREVDTACTIVLISDGNYRNVATVISILLDEGISPTDIYVLAGGLDAWVEAGYPTNTVKSIGC